jgi:hypothetical protein
MCLGGPVFAAFVLVIPSSVEFSVEPGPGPLHPPAVARCIEPDPAEKYLLYIGLNRGWSNQWITLMENIAIAQASNRTLVLSGFRGASLSPKAKYFDGFFTPGKKSHGFAEFFNKEVFSETVRMIELQDFQELCRDASTSIVMHFPKRWYGAQYGNLSSDHDFERWELQEMVFSNASTLALELHRVRRVIHPDPTALPLSYFLSFNQTVMVTDDLYYNVESSVWLQEQHRRLAGSSFRWADSVAVQATDFIAARMPARALGFIAVHLRRGYSTLPPLSVPEVGDVINVLMRAQKLHRYAIFIASNKPETDDLELLKKMTGSVVMRFDGEASSLPEHLISTVEMAICSYASYFVPSPESTWSHGVKLMAVANGAQVMMAKGYSIFKQPTGHPTETLADSSDFM